MRKINPGPFCAEQLAETENHPALVSRRMNTARRIMGTYQTTNLADSSNFRCLPHGSGFTFTAGPSTAMICMGRPFSTGVSLIAFQFRLPSEFFRRSH
jgi:hypothetical protein